MTKITKMFLPYFNDSWGGGGGGGGCNKTLVLIFSNVLPSFCMQGGWWVNF